MITGSDTSAERVGGQTFYQTRAHRMILPAYSERATLMKHAHRLIVASLALLAGQTGSVFAQDSVSVVPGAGDALNVYDAPTTNRYVVDSVPLTSSWGNVYRIAPVLKANGDDDPLFTTQLLGSAAASADQLVNLVPTPVGYSLWTTAGAGINTLANSVPGSTTPNTFTRQFGLGFSDFASVATNVVGALVGQRIEEPDRLYVTRITAVSSRLSAEDPNTSTSALGAVDATGNLYLRADGFGATAQGLLGDNIVRVNLLTRNSSVNRLFFSGTVNRGDQTAASTFLLNNGSATTNSPSAIPASFGSPIAIVLDFANNYRPNGGAGVVTHLSSGLSHRGNPSFSTVNTLGGVGTVASLAKANASARVQSINLFAVTATGTVVTTRGATLPTSITDGQGFTSNAGGLSEFLQYLSQTTFRGGNGQVGLGFDPGLNAPVAAAVATDPVQGEYVAVARFGVSTTWTVAAFEGKQVLDGPSGLSVGTIANVSPVSFSAPAVDLQGNVYFVAAFQPTVGPLGTAFIKAVNTASGYRLERILASGQTFTGANSSRMYTIERLTLADSDSVASGTFFSGNLLQPLFPNQTPTGASDPRSFGGAVVNAQITYNNTGVPETYQATLFIGPAVAPPPPVCLGDANGDNMVNFADITAVLTNFGNVYQPGSGGAGDANNDGPVNFADITTVLTNFGNTCP